MTDDKATIERLTAERDALAAEARRLTALPGWVMWKRMASFARDCASNWDHDADAHKYGTPCFVCDAEKIVLDLDAPAKAHRRPTAAQDDSSFIAAQAKVIDELRAELATLRAGADYPALVIRGALAEEDQAQAERWAAAYDDFWAQRDAAYQAAATAGMLPFVREARGAVTVARAERSGQAWSLFGKVAEALGFDENAPLAEVIAAAKARPAPLTEAEARAWAIRALHEAGAAEWHPVVNDVAGALLCAARGEVPPEARPVADDAPDSVDPADLPPDSERRAGLRGLAAREAAAAPWAPKPGDRVRTVDPLTSGLFSPSARKRRRAGGDGVVLGAWGCGNVFDVRHDDGTEVPYDLDELRPVPAGGGR